MGTPMRNKAKNAKKTYIATGKRTVTNKNLMRKDVGATAASADALVKRSTLMPTTPLEDEDLLTNRQKETLRLLAQGFSNKQIAHQLNISVKTVDAHRASIMTRLRIHNLAGLVKYAIRIGLTTLD